MTMIRWYPRHNTTRRCTNAAKTYTSDAVCIGFYSRYTYIVIHAFESTCFLLVSAFDSNQYIDDKWNTRLEQRRHTIWSLLVQSHNQRKGRRERVQKGMRKSHLNKCIASIFCIPNAFVNVCANNSLHLIESFAGLSISFSLRLFHSLEGTEPGSDWVPFVAYFLPPLIPTLAFHHPLSSFFLCFSSVSVLSAIFGTFSRSFRVFFHYENIEISMFWSKIVKRKSFPETIPCFALFHQRTLSKNANSDKNWDFDYHC